jgi:hypothetical protein
MVQYKEFVACDYHVHQYFKKKQTKKEEEILPWGWVRVRMAKAPPNLLCMLQL